MKICKRCGCGMLWFETRKRCFVCILHALNKWPSLHIYRRRDQQAERDLINEVNGAMKGRLWKRTQG